MRILLLVPPYRTTDALTAQLYPMPLGPVILATVLSDAGHEVVLRDFLAVGPRVMKTKCQRPGAFEGKSAPPYLHYGQPMDEAIAWVEATAPEFDVVGLAGAQCNIWETSQLLADAVRRAGVPLVGGGPFVTTATEEAVGKFGLDVAVRGEGEWVVVEACERAAAGETGVVLNGFVGANDITTLPLPNWRFAPPIHYPHYMGKVRGVLTVSRGCPWGCEFCSVHTVMTRHHRRQDKDRIVQELTNLWLHGVKYFSFLDDNLLISEKAADTVLQAVAEFEATTHIKGARYYIEEGIEVRMAARPGLLANFAKKWDNLALGLETANASSAKRARKPYTHEDLQAAVQACRELDVPTKAFYIVGFPGDTMESICRDIVQFAEYGLTVRSNNLKLYPGTPMTEQFEKAGWVDLQQYDWRLSTFYTPTTDTLTYKQIRKLKVYLNAVGLAAGQLGINPFTCTWQEAKKAFAAHRHELRRSAHVLCLFGNFFRPTPYRVIMELLMARFAKTAGAYTLVSDKQITAHAIDAPKDEYQGAMLAAMRGTACAQATDSRQLSLFE